MDEPKEEEYLYKNYDEPNSYNTNKEKFEENFDKENYLRKYKNENLIAREHDSIHATNQNYKEHPMKIQIEKTKSTSHDLKEIQNSFTNLDDRSHSNQQNLFTTYKYYPLRSSSNKTGDHLNGEEIQDIIAESSHENEEDEKGHNNSKPISPSISADDVRNSEKLNRCKLIEAEDDIEKTKDDVTSTRNPSSQSHSISSYEGIQTIATTSHPNISKHINQLHIVKDLEQQILQGHQLNINSLLDVAGSLCAGPMGPLCDMAGFSKLDPGCFDDLKDDSNQDFLAKKYYHPLYVHGVCRWPGCELPLENMSTFVKHLKSEHCLDDRSTAQARVQMQVVSQLEMHLQKERDRLQAMMHHLYLTKHFGMSDEAQENITHIRYKSAIRSVSTTPDLKKNNNNNCTDECEIGNDLQSLLMNSGNINSSRKRICDKSPLAITGGLPYMLERAGLDVQQEIQRNREFYKNADVRPPFTYASLIRQSIIESPDKQLTLNEIYNWFQNTFCYFRRNAATWKNAIRTNLSLHKCFVRYEDDFGSFWMVDDSEFVKRRHLSRGRPRGYGPSSSPNSNSQQFANTAANTTTPSDIIDSGHSLNESVAHNTSSPGLSAIGTSSRQRCTNRRFRSDINHISNENSGGNDDYDVCEVSQRSPAGCNTYSYGSKQSCSSKQRPQLQGSLIGVTIRTDFNSFNDHNSNENSNKVEGVVVAGDGNLGVGGIGDIGSVGGLDTDNHIDSLNIASSIVENDESNVYDFHTESVSNDTIVNPSKGNNGRFSPNLQNTWSFGSAINNEVSSAEFSCINSEHYRNFVTGLHLQSLTQRHRFHQQKSTAQCIHPKSQLQQSAIRNNTYNQQHNTRSLHQENAYHIYHTIQEDDQNPQLRHDQQQNQDIITNNTDKYFDHKMECHNESNNNYKYESFHSGQHQQQLFSIRHHLHHTRSAENNNLYFAHHNGQEIDVKYNPALLEQNLSRSDVNMRNKRSKSANKSTDAAAEEDDSGIVDCDSDEIHSKRKKKYIFSLDYDDIEIKMESGSESGIRNIDLPLRTKSY